jgi:hypothetical protein
MSSSSSDESSSEESLHIHHHLHAKEKDPHIPKKINPIDTFGIPIQGAIFGTPLTVRSGFAQPIEVKVVAREWNTVTDFCYKFGVYLIALGFMFS